MEICSNKSYAFRVNTSPPPVGAGAGLWSAARCGVRSGDGEDGLEPAFVDDEFIRCRRIGTDRMDDQRSLARRQCIATINNG